MSEKQQGAAAQRLPQIYLNFPLVQHDDDGSSSYN